MPPRISPSRLPPPTCTQCLRTRPQYHPEVIHPTSSRRCEFSTSSPQSTRLRRNMFAWLRGPGKVFRNPLPGSSNYLSAYDKQGQLLRTRNNELDSENDEDAELDEDESAIQTRELEEGVSQEEVSRRAAQREKRRAERREREERGGLPRERQGDLRPFPLNREFRSQPVLSQELREKIYELVVEQGNDLKAVSATFGVDIRRVAAVVRLMSVEREWVKEGKPLAKPYNAAVLSMLPQTPFRPNLADPYPHEPINDLPVHPHTRQQIFVPTSESRAFTRVDAAKTFSRATGPALLPADERIAHPELIQIQKWVNSGKSKEERLELIRERDEADAIVQERKERLRREKEERENVVVKGRRWDFRFQDVTVDRSVVGEKGRGRKAVGIRYGMPHEDRKKGVVKIPTKVE